MRKNKLSEEEKTFAEAYVELYKLGIKMSESDIKFTEKRIKMCEDLLREHYQSKPSKFFKKSYNKWESITKEFEGRIHKLYLELEEALLEYNNLIDFQKMSK